MSKIDCEACNELRENATDFVVNGVTEKACASLENDTGLNPSNATTDAEDLHNVNDCTIGRMGGYWKASKFVTGRSLWPSSFRTCMSY